MITCKKCRTTFRADDRQGYPGHCDPPGSLIAHAILFMVAAIVCGGASVFVFRLPLAIAALAFMVGALLSLNGIPESRRVCERCGGGICPSCGEKNTVEWYS
jgi:hypothetical protein